MDLIEAVKRLVREFKRMQTHCIGYIRYRPKTVPDGWVVEVYTQSGLFIKNVGEVMSEGRLIVKINELIDIVKKMGGE